MKSRVPTFIVGFCIPMTAILIAFPFYNRIEPFIFGLSFNYFWIFSWLFLTSLCLLIAFKMDPYNKEEVSEESAKALARAKEILASGEDPTQTKEIERGGK